MSKNIIISNPKKLANLKQKMAEDGAGNLHILSDFDRTLTKAFVNGKPVISMIALLRDGNYLTSDYANKAKALYQKYHPIEIDPKIGIEEKKKIMNKWWLQHFDLLIKSGLCKKDIENVIKESRLQLRDGTLELLDIIHEYRIPIVILSSSGLGGESIGEFLNRYHKLYNEILIISNSIVFDKRGKAIRFKKPIIHSMNKDETLVHQFPFYGKIKNRKNVILLGDNLGDLGMIAGFDYQNLLKIGFLDEKIEQNLKHFRKNFDILLINNSPMDYINKLLKDIIKKK